MDAFQHNAQKFNNERLPSSRGLDDKLLLQQIQRSKQTAHCLGLHRADVIHTADESGGEGDIVVERGTARDAGRRARASISSDVAARARPAAAARTGNVPPVRERAAGREAPCSARRGTSANIRRGYFLHRKADGPASDYGHSPLVFGSMASGRTADRPERAGGDRRPRGDGRVGGRYGDGARRRIGGGGADGPGRGAYIHRRRHGDAARCAMSRCFVRCHFCEL